MVDRCPQGYTKPEDVDPRKCAACDRRFSGKGPRTFNISCELYTEAGKREMRRS